MIRSIIFNLSCTIIAGLLMALGLHYCRVTTIVIIGLALMAGAAWIYFELIPILFGQPPIDTDHFRRRY